MEKFLVLCKQKACQQYWLVLFLLRTITIFCFLSNSSRAIFISVLFIESKFMDFCWMLGELATYQNLLSNSSIFIVIKVVFPNGEISGSLQAKSVSTILACSFSVKVLPVFTARLLAIDLAMQSF